MIYLAPRVIAIMAAALFGILAYISKRKQLSFSLLRKGIALMLFAYAFVISVIHKEAISSVIGLNHGPSPFGDIIPQTVFATILIWFTYSSILLVVFSQFVKSRILHCIVAFFALPVLVLDFIFFDTYAIANIGNFPSAADLTLLPLIAAMLTIALSLAVFECICDKTYRPDLGETFSIIGLTASAVFASMPSFVPQVLLGFYRFNKVSFSNFTLHHRVMIYLAVLLPLIAFHILKNKDIRTKRICMIFCSVSILWTHMSYYALEDWTSLANLPLGITSMVIILMPYAIIRNNRSIFNCILFLGVITAFTSIMLPNIAALSVAATESTRYWTTQYYAFSVPILCLSLKLFERPKASGLMKALSAFAVYFVFTFLLSTVIQSYGETADYLNFTSNYLLSAFPEFSATIKEISAEITIGNITFVFHPLYELIILVSYEILIALMWFAYKFLFKSWDKADDRRLRERDYEQMKKDLKEFLGDKPQNAPMYGDNSPKLILRQFSKKYGTNKHYSVDHVSFNVKGGEIFGFLGPNGAGKSTIIKSIVGIQTITSGSIEICGYDVERQPIQAKLNTGFVPDHYALYENLTGREYINYIADLYGVDKATRDETIAKYVSRFQLSHSFDNQMKTYSHGMKQKIAIMAALVHNPKVWILDEPLTGLDPNSIYEVKECMKEHAAKGNIVFFSSHIIDVVEKICDKIAIIKKGRIRAAAKMSELDAQNIDLEELYLHVITSDEEDDIINIGGDDIINVKKDENSSLGVGAV